MASPSLSEATVWDPLGMNSPAGRALVILRPENEAAKLAFSDVVDFIKEQGDAKSEGDSTDVRSHYAKFMWFSDDQIFDSAVSRFSNQMSQLESSSSSVSSSGESHPTMIWTGFFFLDANKKPIHSDLGWLVGRLSKKSVSFAQPTVDLVLTVKRFGNVARRHAVISFSKETRLATVSLESGSSAIVNTQTLTSRRSVAGCTVAVNRVNFGDLLYSLEYTSFCRLPHGQEDLEDIITAIHGDDRPTKESIGKYTITGGLTGRGAFGRVRPAVGPDGQKTVVIKTIEARPNRVQYTRDKIELMEFIGQRSKAENQHNVLSLVESIYVQGRQVDEFHIVLEPYVGFTLSEIPKNTHSTKYELILHDCLRGLAFLHSHGVVHTDMKPPNIGLVDFHRDEMHKPAQLASYSRPPRTVILDIDSMEQIPNGQTAIKARPGANGTVGFHSPEHEMSEYDGRTDIWALGVSLFRAIFGALPWSYGPEGNPWREDCKVFEARDKFHARYGKSVNKVANHYHVLGDSEIAAQRRIRPTSAECVDLVEKSELLKERLKREAKIATEATEAINDTWGNKRPASDSYEQINKRETDFR
ncbi:hypothetical protein TrVFT333_008134 [Trichoderma virens FT-333]|nr:hypothetical protein TrVFT333_008134 [Trichoderma virens FT-333]